MGQIPIMKQNIFSFTCQGEALRCLFNDTKRSVVSDTDVGKFTVNKALLYCKNTSFTNS